MFRLSCFVINNNGINERSKKKLESKLIGNMQVHTSVDSLENRSEAMIYLLE